VERLADYINFEDLLVYSVAMRAKKAATDM
jgi:hypothetical protein